MNTCDEIINVVYSVSKNESVDFHKKVNGLFYSACGLINDYNTIDNCYYLLSLCETKKHIAVLTI